jgi:hypothetical protein
MKKLACGPPLHYPPSSLLKPTCSSLSSLLPVEVNMGKKWESHRRHQPLLLHFIVLLLELTNWSEPGAEASTCLA